MDFQDLVDPSFLQQFQDNFALCVGVSSLTEDAQGNALTQSSYFTECCSIIRSSKIGLQRCRQCDMNGGEQAARTGRPAVYHCHAGLTDFAAPIMLEGQQIGAIFGGQILTELPNEKRFRDIAKEIDVDPDKFIAAIKKVPIVPEERIHAAAGVLSSVANTLSKMAYQTLKLQEWNRELVLANSRLNNIFSTMSEGVLIFDEMGVVKKVNRVTENIFGKTASELILNSIEELVGGKAPCCEKILHQHKAYNDIEILIDTSAGRIHCLTSGSPIKDNEGVPSGGVIILRPIEKVQKLINRFNGSEAAFGFGDIIGNSPAFLETIKVASMAAVNMTNVLLQGESGTGKEVFAQAIHNNSLRRKGPFVAINCGAIPRELVGSELFGYTDGAFTGAKRGGRPGKFELASGGTLFLDEIGDMPIDQQVALLRVLQERKITRIGDDKVIPVDVRIICASNKDLAEEVEKANFRQDLYYRLNVISINIPPLRERRDDITLLFNYMLDHIGHEWNSKVKYVDPEVMWLLRDYSWPGNVRELQNVVERIISIAEGEVVRIEHLPESILNNMVKADDHQPPQLNIEDIRENRKQICEMQDYQKITSLLTRHGGNITQAAKEMGVARSTLYRKMQRLNIPN